MLRPPARPLCEASYASKVSSSALRPAAKQAQQVVDQPALCRLARDDGFENVCVSDFPGSPQHLFSLHAVNGCSRLFLYVKK